MPLRVAVENFSLIGFRGFRSGTDYVGLVVAHVVATTVSKVGISMLVAEVERFLVRVHQVAFVVLHVSTNIAATINFFIFSLKFKSCY